MKNTIPHIQKGDTIAIVAPAKAISPELVNYAKHWFETKGFKVVLGQNVCGEINYFSGTDLERTVDFQQAIDNQNIKAIICARGGYGAVRILDSIQWAAQLREPKWIVGFSDITVFHQHLQRFDLPSIHATMPLNFRDNSTDSLETLLHALQGKQYTITTTPSTFNKKGSAKAELIGGNLSIVYSLLGTDSQPNYKGKILFLEEVGEQIYAVDRMLFSLKKAGVFDQIAGLIIGGMTNIKDTTEKPTALQLEEIVLQHFPFRKIPICFDFPAGHIDDNRALAFGELVHLNVGDEVTLHFTRETIKQLEQKETIEL